MIQRNFHTEAIPACNEMCCCCCCCCPEVATREGNTIDPANPSVEAGPRPLGQGGRHERVPLVNVVRLGARAVVVLAHHDRDDRGGTGTAR